MGAYRQRVEKLAMYLKQAGAAAAVIEDSEAMRTHSLRYLCGHPTDAILFVFTNASTVLVPWDVSLAREKADVDRISPYSDFGRSFKDAVAAVVKEAVPAGSSVEISGRTPHARYTELCAVLPDMHVLCRTDGLDGFISGMRALKDADEISALRRAGEIANQLIPLVESFVRAGARTEVELAQLVEREALRLGAEGLGFETLAAGPARSWAIHPFPVYTAGPFGTRGLSILDFGVRVDGYTSDVTLTFARGPLSADQELMITLVQGAYTAAVSACARAVSPLDPARAADDAFSAAGWRMPHSLGHGIGLDAHERPYLRVQGEISDPVLLPGMAFTLEPGLYHPEQGGVRLENDVLMTESGAESLTKASIIRL